MPFKLGFSEPNCYICELFDFMKKLTVLFALILSTNIGHAQINELGLYLGGTNFIGDIGATNYINPKKVAFGVIYKWNINSRYALRGSIIHGKLQASDFDSDSSARVQRGFTFDNDVTEFSTGIEFNFFDFDLHQERPVATPYVSLGLGIFFYDGLFYDTAGTQLSTDNEMALNIPMIVGFKTNITPKFVLGAEIGARYTFTDGIDGSNPDFFNGVNNIRFGNVNSDDWYVFTGLTLTYAFTKKPCYSCFDEN